MVGVLGGLIANSYIGAYFHILLVIIFGLYFLIPANIWIYGINDIYDYETDKLNPKKTQWYEALVEPREQKSLRKWILATSLPFLAYSILLSFWPNIFGYYKLQGVSILANDIAFGPYISLILSFLVFLFFSSQYSAKPIRAKARPILDSFFSAWHYIATAVFGYFLVNPIGSLNWYYIVAGMSWAMAMHAFSAVPDIQADKDAKLATIATFLWWKATIWACLALYLVASILSYSFLWRVSLILWAVYCGLMMLAITYYGNEKKVFALYKRFPWINTASWMILFFVVLCKVL
jgi:lycopene elongase/hydratase (dihydrobisanhydrobacterioruberin-forming)